MPSAIQPTKAPLSGRAFTLFILAFLLTGPLTQAQFYYVKPTASGTGTGGSWANAAGATQLQTIISAAASGSQVWVAAGTYIPNAYPPGSSGGSTAADDAFELVNGVAVYGGFAGTETLLSQRNVATNVTILSGNNTCNHVVVSEGNNSTAILDGFTIEKGRAGAGTVSITLGGQTFTNTFGGGILCMSSAPAISNCTITGNTATSGGGVYNRSSPGPTFTNCTFSGNTASSTSDGGGAVYDYSGSILTFSGCTFSANTASANQGGAVYSSGGTMSFTTCTLGNNTAAADGGAIYIVNSANLTITGSNFNSNTATGNGGAIAIESNCPVTISNSGFTSNVANSATGGGGGIYNLSNPSCTITSSVFSGNRATEYGGGFYANQGGNGSVLSSCWFKSDLATYGGGVANAGGSAPTINKCKVSNCTATYGGGLYNVSGSPSFSVDTVQSNTASATSGMGGGGMLNDASANPIVSHCWFNANVTSGADGAGQYDVGSSGIDSNCVFQANIAGGSSSNGGGYVHGGSTGSILNCVFVNNSCSGDGGGAINTGGSETYMSCTFYNNSSGNATTGGDGFYVSGGTKPHLSGVIIWSGNASSVGLVIGSGTPKINYSDIQGVAVATLDTYGGNNISTAPSFGNSGNYVGTDGMWATADDGLHLTGSAAADGVPLTSGYTVTTDDITDAVRPDETGEPNADMGAYEGGGTFAVLAENMVTLTAEQGGPGSVELSWQVELSTAAADYVVERAVDGGGFQSIGNLAGQAFYRFEDNAVPAGVVSYRVQMRGADSAMVTSNIVSFTEVQRGYTISLRPSVIGQGTAAGLFIACPHAMTIDMVIVDGSGAQRMHRVTSLSAGSQTIALSGLSFSAGVYYLRLRGDDGFETTIPFVKL